MEWWERMPKLELHAHLNGCIRNSTLLELAKDLEQKRIIVLEDVERVIKKSDRSLSEVFKIFDLIHILTTNHKTISRITKEVIEDFASENVIYLELRTSPKQDESVGMSKRSYMDAVIEGLTAVVSVEVDFTCESFVSQAPVKSVCVCMNDTTAHGGAATRKKIYVRLLLSIDRHETADAAMETVELALDMRKFGVVGIDLSGNPAVGQWSTFLPALKHAREQGLYVTLHCGEL